MFIDWTLVRIVAYLEIPSPFESAVNTEHGLSKRHHSAAMTSHQPDDTGSIKTQQG
jgi:hypothetical protein